MILVLYIVFLQKQYPNMIHSARGAGTFCAVDCYDVETRDKIVGLLRNRGFQTAGSGDMTIRFRPSLVFQPKHAHMFLEGMEAVLREIR